MTLTKQLLKVALKVVLKLLQLFVETMMTIYIHDGRHWIPHHNKPTCSDNDCELDVIIYVVHQRRLSMNEDQTWLHFMNMSCMALRKYRMETRLWGACSVSYAVHRAGDSVLNLISACQSDDWECIFVALETSHNLPQPPTPSTSYTPVTTHTPPATQTPHPPTLHNHPHPSTTHIPPTTPHPKPHSFQNYTHSKTTHTHPTAHTHQPHTLTIHTLQPHTYPPTTHISQPPTPDASPSCTNEYTETRWPRYMKSINVKIFCCGQIKCSVHLPVHWPHSWAGQDVEAAHLDGWSTDGAALITTTPHIACSTTISKHLPSEYYLLYKNCVVRSRANVLKLRHFIELHYVGIVHLP